MWQIVSGSYYYRIDEAIPYSYYLAKSQSLLLTRSADKDVKTHQDVCEEIERVSRASKVKTFSFSHNHRMSTEVFLIILTSKKTLLVSIHCPTFSVRSRAETQRSNIARAW